MNIDVQGMVGHGDKPLTRADVERLLREAGSSEKLDLSGRILTGIDLTGLDHVILYSLFLELLKYLNFGQIGGKMLTIQSNL